MKIKSLVTIKAKDMMRLILIIMKQLHDKNMEKSLDMNQFKLEKNFYKTGSQKVVVIKDESDHISNHSFISLMENYELQ